MSVFSDLVQSKVQGVLSAAWDIRDGSVVPTSDTVKLSGGAVKLDATYLYADLADSSGAAQKLKKEVTGKIVRSYLDAASRVVRHFGGEIRGFDGDRVMGIFVGDRKNTNALRAGLGINWAVHEVLKPKFAAAWSDLGKYWSLTHGVGIDAGEAFIVRGGVRDNNDLISIGSAPNVAAKLSGVRGWPDIYVTQRAYNIALDEAKYTKKGELMWADANSQTIGGHVYAIKSSTWWSRP